MEQRVYLYPLQYHHCHIPEVHWKARNYLEICRMVFKKNTLPDREPGLNGLGHTNLTHPDQFTVA
jgi:hypothetical protein